MTVPTTLPRSPAGAMVAANGTMSWGTMVAAPSAEAGDGQPREAGSGRHGHQVEGHGRQHRHDETAALEQVAQGHEEQEPERIAHLGKRGDEPHGAVAHPKSAPCPPAAAGCSKGWRPRARTRSPSSRSCAGRSSRRFSLRLSADRAIEQVGGDLLDSLVGPVGARPVRPGQRVPRRRRQALGPEDRRGVEHEIPLRARVDRRGPVLGRLRLPPRPCPRRRPRRPGIFGRVAVVLPADQAGDAVAPSCRCPRRSSGRA